MSFPRVKTAILGCGAISPAYLRNLTTTLSGVVDIVACCDIVPELARQRAGEFGVPMALPVAEMLARDDIELVVNLTPAPAHHDVSLQVLRAGKHLFSEKPLALTRAQAREILDLAASTGLSVGGAADTFLGGGLQAVRTFLDDGGLGNVAGADSLVVVPKHNSAHYYRVFRGPVLDISPYYIGALVTLMGSVRRVSAVGQVRFPGRVSSDAASAGSAFTPEMASTVAAALELESGVVASMLITADVPGYYPMMRLHGSAGSLLLPDANFYHGPAILREPAGERSIEASGFGTRDRGLGVAEMALAMREGRPPRSSGELMFHVLDVQLAIGEAAETGRQVEILSRAERPAPFEAASVLAPQGSTVA